MSELYSYSKISSFHNCSWAWYLNYVKKVKGEDNVYGILGNVIHECYENITKGEITIDKAVETFCKKYYQCVDEGYEFPTENSGEKYYEDIVHSLKTFKNFNDCELKQELYFEHELCDIKFRGYIDLIIINHKEKTIQILDWKSSSKFSKKDLESSKVFQLILYSLVVKDVLGEKYKDYTVINPIFYMLKYCEVRKKSTNRKTVIERVDLTDDYEYLNPYIVEIQYNQDMIDKLKDYINDVYTDIILRDEEDETEWYPEKTNDFFCKNLCGYSNDCKFYKPNKYNS